MVLENDDLRLSVAEKGQEKALAAFDWDIAGDRYFQLIHSLCS
jgi:hypothetical protein